MDGERKGSVKRSCKVVAWADFNIEKVFRWLDFWSVLLRTDNPVDQAPVVFGFNLCKNKIIISHPFVYNIAC